MFGISVYSYPLTICPADFCGKVCISAFACCPNRQPLLRHSRKHPSVPRSLLHSFQLHSKAAALTELAASRPSRRKSQRAAFDGSAQRVQSGPLLRGKAVEVTAGLILDKKVFHLHAEQIDLKPHLSFLTNGKVAKQSARLHHWRTDVSCQNTLRSSRDFHTPGFVKTSAYGNGHFYNQC